MNVEFYEADQRLTRQASRRNAEAANARLADDDEAERAFQDYWNAAYAEQEARGAAEPRR